jgi:hypothetical protein
MLWCCDSLEIFDHFTNTLQCRLKPIHSRQSTTSNDRGSTRFHGSTSAFLRCHASSIVSKDCKSPHGSAQALGRTAVDLLSIYAATRLRTVVAVGAHKVWTLIGTRHSAKQTPAVFMNRGDCAAAKCCDVAAMRSSHMIDPTPQFEIESQAYFKRVPSYLEVTTSLPYVVKVHTM